MARSDHSRSSPLISPVTARAPAKLNLHLRVGPVRADGFHDLVTVYHAVSLYDEVRATRASALSITVGGVGASSVPLDRTNLAVRAATALAHRAGVEPLAHLHIDKAIPVAGGLAGGSADAAAALVACNALWDTRLPPAALVELAADLGSDVPFALTGGTALGTGHGELVQPVPDAGDWHWVLAVADGGLSTPAVYRAYDERTLDRPTQDRPPQDGLAAILDALRAGVPAALGQAMGNDLQAAALCLRPELRRTLDAGATLGARGCLVSGSGPTCAFLAATADAAAHLARALSAAGVCRSAQQVSGPAAGAQLLAAGSR